MDGIKLARYVTVADSMAQVTNAFVAAQTLPDGSTQVGIKIQAGESMITMIGSGITIDGAWTIDTGNNFTIRFSGKASVDGEQEINIGALKCDETGTSVTGTLTALPATYQPVQIRVKEGDLTVSFAYDGTDPGTPFAAVTLEIQ